MRKLKHMHPMLLNRGLPQNFFQGRRHENLKHIILHKPKRPVTILDLSIFLFSCIAESNLQNL